MINIGGLIKRVWNIVLFACIILIPLVLTAQDNISLADIADSQIIEIIIEGNSRIQEELIRSLLTFEIGDILATKETSKTIQNLYNLEVFDDVSISLNVSIPQFRQTNFVEMIQNKKACF